MPSNLKEIPQSAEKGACLQAVYVFLKTGFHYLTHCDRDCLDGEHKAWITVETDRRDPALKIVPPAFRHDAEVIQLDRFTLEQVERIMEKHAG